MPAKAPAAPAAVAARLALLGQRIRAQRMGLGVSANALAESAGLSRHTVCRIEHGVPSVTMGAYLNALAALGMDLAVVDHLPPADVPTCRRADVPTCRLRRSKAVRRRPTRLCCRPVFAWLTTPSFDVWSGSCAALLISRRRGRWRCTSAIGAKSTRRACCPANAARWINGCVCWARGTVLVERLHHRRIATVLASLDTPMLSAHGCYVNGGTAIALGHGEYRESVDISFLVCWPHPRQPTKCAAWPR